MNPLVSICVPTRNRVTSLEKSLQSILRQDYAPIEVIISDNASTDGTEAFGRALARSDRRVRYVRHDANLGLHGNHNFCLGAGTGEFLCVCHDHDDRDSAIVSTCVAFLCAHPDVGVVCSDWELIDEAGNRLGYRDHDVAGVTPGLEFIERTIRSGCSSVGIPGAMIRRSALGGIRFIDDAPVGFGDFAVWLEMAERWNIGHLKQRLWRWTQSRDSQSARTVASASRDYYVNLTRYCDDHLLRWPQRGRMVARWKESISRYLFWALAYEIGLYFRSADDRGPRASSAGTRSATLFELLGYRLRPEEFEDVLARLRDYRTGSLEHGTYLVVMTLIALNFTWPLAWSVRHHAQFRKVLGLG